MKNHKHLIIGGTTKAATTSLYNYLSDHPDVCVSTLKETRFFLDSDYPVSPLSFHWSNGLEKYEKFFKHCSDAATIRVEATPDYLYSPGTPIRIKETLPNAKIVFILRNPIDRIISWYKYAKQRTFISHQMTFDEYIEWQIKIKNSEKNNYFLDKKNNCFEQKYFMSVLEQGRYSVYLKPYVDVFNSDQIKIILFEELKKEPDAVLEKICIFIEINPELYTNYTFGIFNRTKTINNVKVDRIYSQLRSGIRQYTHNLPMHRALSQMRQWFDSIYYKINSVESTQIEISNSTKLFLINYYEKEAKDIEYILNRPVPWKLSTSNFEKKVK